MNASPLRYRHFAKEVLKLSFYLIILTGVFYFFEFFTPFQMISWLSIMSYMLFHLSTGYYICRSFGKPVFTPIYFFFMGLEFMGSLLFILLWRAWANPDNFGYVFIILGSFAIYKIVTSIIIFQADGEN